MKKIMLVSPQEATHVLQTGGSFKSKVLKFCSIAAALAAALAGAHGARANQRAAHKRNRQAEKHVLSFLGGKSKETPAGQEMLVFL